MPPLEAQGVLTLRPYQTDVVDRVLARLADRPIMAMPTGSGKTLCAVELVRRLARKTLWIAHKTELITQARDRFVASGFRVGVIKADWPRDSGAEVQVASIDTYHRRSAVPGVGLVVVDECHRAAARTYRKVVAWHPDASLLGLTATPCRADGKPLGDIFGAIVESLPFADLAALGFLVEPQVFVPESPDLRKVHIVRGDFDQKDSERVMNTVRITGNVVRTWLGKAPGRKTVAFTVSCDHSRAVVAAFREAGVPFEHVDANTPEDERRAIMDRWRTGATVGVSNVGIVTEGFDLPSLEVAIVARPTASLVLHRQCIGRITRSTDGKFGALVLDHAGNHERLGRVSDPQDWSLEERLAPVRRPAGKERPCPRCFLLVPRQIRECPGCGYAWPLPRGRSVEEDDGDLVEFGQKRVPVPYDTRRDFWNSVEAERLARGGRESGSGYAYLRRFGTWPVVVDGQLVNTEHPSEREMQEVYKKFARDVLTHAHYKVGYAAARWKAVFGRWPPWAWGQALQRKRDQLQEVNREASPAR